ncbi:MAG: MMPL family transporter [Verrucomicrobiota bacterium]
MPARWTRFVLRHRNVVILSWIVVVVLGLWSSTRLHDRLTTSFDVPGTDSHRAAALLGRHFGVRPEGTFTVVFPVARPSDRALRARLQLRLDRAAASLPTGGPGVLRSGGRVLYGDVTTALSLSTAKRYTDDLRRALRSRGGPAALVTGEPAIQHDLDPLLASDLRRGEALALPVALLVLVAMLGLSLAVAVPFAVAVGAISATLGIVYLVASATPVVAFVPNLVELIGLALAIDYSLLIVLRYREELIPGRSREQAMAATMATAGRAVAFSGLAVAIGLGLLLVMPIPFIRGLGLGGLLVPLAAVAAGLTLLPALLSCLRERPRGRRATDEDGTWARVARRVMGRPVRHLIAGTVILLAAAAPALGLQLTPGSIKGLPSSSEAVQGYSLLSRRVGLGAVTPIQLVVDAGSPGAARADAVRSAIERLADRIAGDPEAYVIASGRRPPYVDPTGRYARVIVAGRHEYGEPASRSFVRRLRDRLVAASGFPAGVRVYAGGIPPQGVDFLARSYAVFPWLVLGVLASTFAALTWAFRSLLLPLKAVLLNLLTVSAVYGLLVVIFRWGVGSGLGLHRSDQVEGWIPIFLFAVLFGLSMDYEVFMVTRMREAWDARHDNRQAVAIGLERTGRIVTAAAAIMIVAFAGFAVGRVPGLQELGVGLALAVFLDATLVRVVLVPSLMAILGRWNWWLPGRAAGHAERGAPDDAPLSEHTV